MTSGSDGLLLEHFPDKRYVDVPGLCGVADLAAIEEQGWSLNPGRFIEFRPPEAMSEEEFAHAVSALQVELLDLDTAAMQLTAAVQEVLRMAAMTLNRGPLRDLIASYVGAGGDEMRTTRSTTNLPT